MAAIVVVKGYVSFAANAKPVIEHKLLAKFEPGKTLALKVELAEACLNRADQCEGLALTCASSSRGATRAGSCTHVQPGPDAGVADAEHTTDDDAGQDMSEPVRDPPPSECEIDNRCTTAYPCVPSSSFGYSCQGQLAEWPMPDALQGAKFAPNYDVESSPGETIDKVTGLIWQRRLPTIYESCTGALNKVLDTCTWSEALRYCATFNQGGHRWRLPTKIELESLIDYTVRHLDTALIDQVAFPNTPSADFWTSSPDAFDATKAWGVFFGNGAVGQAPRGEARAVRCVRSVPLRAGTPDERYELDEATSTVTDRRTRLSWNLSVYGADLGWETAQAECAALGGGYRLPTPKELLTVIDPRHFGPAVHDAFRLSNYRNTDLIWSSYREPWADGIMVMASAFGSLSTERALGNNVQRKTGDSIQFTYHALCVR
jgi:hypothetical protein